MNSVRDLHGLVADNLARVVDLRAHLDGAEIELDANQWLDAIEGETDFQEAIGCVAEAILELDGNIAGIKAMEQKLADRRRRTEHNRESLRGIILAAMDKADVKSIKRPFVTISAAEKPRGLANVDEALVPSRFFIEQAPKLDTTALRAALQQGEDVPGASLDNGGLTLIMRFV